MLTPSLCYASSIDKTLHISASAVTETVLAHNKPFCTWKPWQRSLFNVAVIGGGKELLHEAMREVACIKESLEAAR